MFQKSACHSERSLRSEESPISFDADAITEETGDCRFCFRRKMERLLRFFAALRMTFFSMGFGFAEKQAIPQMTLRVDREIPRLREAPLARASLRSE
jgi:hypothetical protein